MQLPILDNFIMGKSSLSQLAKSVSEQLVLIICRGGHPPFVRAIALIASCQKIRIIAQ